MKSSLKNMVLTLLGISFVSAAAVGLVCNVTAEPIAKAKAEKGVAALRAVLPPFDNDPTQKPDTVTVDNIPSVVYTAMRDGEVAGYAVQALSRNGFGGDITLMVGFRPDGQIVDIEVLGHNETPGLGSKIKSDKKKQKPGFSAQFAGKHPADFRLAVKKDGGDVDAITASTISSRAFAEAVQRAYNAMMETTKASVHE